MIIRAARTDGKARRPVQINGGRKVTRREAREHCFKMLFSVDFYTTGEEAKAQMQQYFQSPEEDDTAEDGSLQVVHKVAAGEKDREYLSTRTADVVDKIEEIDAKIDEVAAGWKTKRMGKVELTILRLAVYEMLYDDTIPEKVSVNEAVELAKKFGGNESPAFVNGVLAKFIPKEEKKEETKDVKAIQKQVLRNPGVWILALSSAFMYMSRYAINGWGVLFLQKVKGFDLGDATFIISINAILGVIGTIFSGWISDVAFRGDRKYPAFVAGVLETIALALFLFGGNSWTLNIIAMILFGIAIGVLICFVGGLMAVDIVPREATGAALGVVGMASYLAAGVQDIISGILIDGNAVETVVDGAKVMSYDFGPVSWFWIAAAAISFILPVFNWKRKVKE